MVRITKSESAEKEKANFYGRDNGRNRVGLLSLDVRNAETLLLVFVILVVTYALLLLLPWPIDSSGKTLVDVFVGRISRFILVAFLVVLVIDLLLSKSKPFDERVREIVNEEIKRRDALD